MNRRKIELIVFDTFVMAAVYGATALFSLRNFSSLEVNDGFTAAKLLLLFVCLMGMRLVFRTYSNVWRYANAAMYLKTIAADIAGGALFIAIGFFVPEIGLGIGYSLLTIMAIIIVTLSSRYIYQLAYAYVSRNADNRKNMGKFKNRIHKINIAIVGAGNVGATLSEELLRNPQSHYNPYCFIDKEKSKIGSRINGLTIYPEDDKIIDRIKSMPIQEIVIALPDAASDEKLRLFEFYKQTACKVKLYDYPLGADNGPADKRTLREFKIEDLLFRESLSINGEATKEYYSGKTVLVTGGGGSIGSELCRQIAKLNPKKLVILDIYENNAYEIQQELIAEYGKTLSLDTIIASVRDVKRLEQVFRAVRPDVVLHAAAHKHVPLMERSSCEAIKNNVMGTYNTANMAEKYGVQKFLLISTDKAVNPTNVMGASKRLCEMVIQCRKDSKTEFTAVRFGNVLGSNGSVIPLFKNQIKAGGPITLTDKRIIRYFMTIPEAAQLVLEAGAMAHNGELFVLDMGKPVKILDLAENMIKLSGLKPYEDIDIQEIGLRPGEKLYEELLMKTEELDKTSNKMIFIERDKPLSREEVDAKLKILLKAVETEGHDNIVAAIKATVPTYCDPDEVNKKSSQSAEMAMVFNSEDK